ncbi:MAG: hypothetical protein J2P48_19500 [Alphaproteobacteria bacterium]|nr:hypothetical protein [Alphaproteobacteria bacterium]
MHYATVPDTGDVEATVGCFAEDGALRSPIVGTYEWNATDAIAPHAAQPGRDDRRRLGSRGLLSAHSLTCNGL